LGGRKENVGGDGDSPPIGRRTRDEKEARELLERVQRSEEAIEQIEFRRMLGGEHDPSNGIVSVNAGAGGTEAQDWVEMLLRMYLRWAEKKKFETKIIDILTVKKRV